LVNLSLGEVGVICEVKPLQICEPCKQITDAGLKEVAKMKQLKELDLKNTKTITKEGVAELQKALPKCKILWP
tara:strand:- start:455 stop:673 length:219 start_codon:yes stop_codon:yes gene_type:complete